MGDDTKLTISVARTKQGIILAVKGNAILEDYMMGLGNGTQEEVMASGKNWMPLNGEALKVWNGNLNLLREIAAGSRFMLDQPGQKLELQSDFGNGYAYNLSFLRLCGISNGDGVRFLLKNTVLGNDGIMDLRDKLISYTKQLYTNFIRPIEAVGEITTAKEIME